MLATAHERISDGLLLILAHWHLSRDVAEENQRSHDMLVVYFRNCARSTFNPGKIVVAASWQKGGR